MSFVLNNEKRILLAIAQLREQEQAHYEAILRQLKVLQTPPKRNLALKLGMPVPK